MIGPRPLLLAAAIVMLLTPLGAGAGDPVRECQVPPELVDDELRLPQLGQLLQANRPITIVAIGGASTSGMAAKNPDEDAYPRRLQNALRQRHPGVPISVVNKGIPRQTTQDMVDRFGRDVYKLTPNVVIWETGNFDAARNVDVDTFANALASGLTDLREHNVEVILIDMQYSRSSASVINFEPYLDAMQRAADVDGVYRFRRFEMMKYWSENGVFDFVDTPKEQRAQFAGDVYRCIAERLADAIEHAIR